MRFTLFEPAALSAHHAIRLAQEAEACGFDSFAINDGTFQMMETRGHYPFSKDHKRNWDLKAPFYEPLSVLTAVSQHTSRIRLFPSVLKLPLHAPLLLAKQIATMAILSDDRLALGVGSSWAPEEFEFCNVDWNKRGKIVEESIEVLRLVLSGKVVEFHGDIFDFAPLVAQPAPRKPVRILLGGHLDASLQRAARIADGWIAVGPDSFEQLQSIINRLRALCAEFGRDWSQFEIHATPRDTKTLDDFRRLEDLGVTDAMTLPLSGAPDDWDRAARERLTGQPVSAARDADQLYSRSPPQQRIDAIRAFSETIIAPFRNSQGNPA